MVIDLKDRARGCFAALAAGDALGSPTEGKSPAEISARWGRVTGFLSPEQGGSDDTEYALFSSRLLLNKGKALTALDAADAWLNGIVKGNNAYKGAGFSEMLTIRNLLKGLKPPASGQHLHCWSDGLAMRAAPYGIACAGDPKLAARLTAIEGSVSHSGEGIFSGQAVAAAISIAMTSAGHDDAPEKVIEKVIKAALENVPRDSWTYESIKRASEIGLNAGSVWEALEPLYNEIAHTYYWWSDLGPEAVGMAFGIFAAAKGSLTDAVLGAVNAGRDTDTIAAITGAISGALYGLQAVPEEWIARITVSRGICIRAVAGMSIIDTADELAQLAIKWRGENEK